MIELHTLGRLDVRGDDGTVIPAGLAQPKRFALLVYLALARPAGFRRRDTLTGIFWPELDRERARGALRKAVHYLRGALGEGAITSRGADEIGVDAALLRCDAVEFQALLDRNALQEAMSLYRGELLPGFFVSGAPEFERWLDAERARLRQSAIDATWRLAENQVEGNKDAALAWARRAVELDPGGERSVQRLIRTLERFGERPAALAVFEEHRHWLEDELGLEPAAETVALVESIRTGTSPAGGGPASPSPHPVPRTAPAPDSEGPGGVPVPPAIRATDLRQRFTRVAPVHIVAALAVVLVVTLLAMTGGGGPVAPGSDSSPILAVGAIRDFTGSAERELARSLGDLLATSLTAGGGVHVLHTPRPGGGREDAGAINTRLARTARQAGATELIEGALYELPDRRYRFDVRRVELGSGTVREGYSVVGANLFDLADLAAAQLRAHIVPTALRLAPVRDATERIAVLPFGFRGRPDLAYLAEGIVPLLSATLDGGVGLRAVSPQQVLSTFGETGNELAESTRAQLVAQRLGAALYVNGSIIEVDGRLRIDAYLIDGSRPTDAVARGSVIGEPERLLALVDQLTGQLLAARGQPGDRIFRLATTSTTSLPALKAYLSGERYLRGGWFAEAMESFQEAASEDTLFALAQYRLAVSAMWADRGNVADDALIAAVRLRDRLPDRDRQLLEGLNALRVGDADGAERRYRSILASYVDDAEAWWQLGEVLFHLNPLRGRPIAEARYPLQQTLAFAPDHVPARFHLILLGAMERSNGLDTLIARTYGAGSPLMVRALAALAGSRTHSPAAQIEEFRGASEAMIAATILAAPFAADQVTALVSLARLLTTGDRSPEARAFGHIVLAHLETTRGRWRSARAELDRAESFKPAWALQHRALLSAAPHLVQTPAEVEWVRDRLLAWDGSTGTSTNAAGPWFQAYEGVGPELRLYLLGLLHGALGEQVEVGRAASNLEQLASRTDAVPAAAMAAGLRANLHWNQNRTREALQALESAQIRVRPTMAGASPFHALGRERFLRALLLQREGRLAEALRWHTSLEESTIFDLVHLAPSLLERAEIYQRLGERESAALAYRRFLDLWADADVELEPIVSRARNASAALRQGDPGR